MDARRYGRILGVVLMGFTIMGLLPQLSTTFGLMPLFGHDVWLHGVEAMLALYLGFVSCYEGGIEHGFSN